MNYHNVKFETSYGFSAQLPPSDLPEIAFAGRSNVGKSSAINKIFNRKQLARVSSVPGKTVTINFFRAGEIRFADLPGYGFARVSKSEKKRWAELMEGYFAQQRDLRLVFQLIDMRHPPTADDLVMIDFLLQKGQPFVILLTKKDKLSKRQQQERLEALKSELPQAEELRLIPFSSQTGEGVDEVRAVIDAIEEAQQLALAPEEPLNQ